MLFEINNLSKTYYDDGMPITVLRGITMDIARGEFIGIMGPSGAGKSTFLHILGLMDAVFDGNIKFEGLDITKLDDSEKSGILRKKIGFLFQFHYLINELNVFENVALPLRLIGDYRAGKIDALLDSLGVVEKKNFYPHELSGGERQRVSLARALIKEPEVLFCDEPTGNLDTANGDIVKNLLHQKFREKKFTMLLVTHNPELCEMADKTIHMLDGRIT